MYLQKLGFVFQIIIFSLTSCCKDDTSPICDTCNDFQLGYVIGFDPCTGVYEPNSGSVGFILAFPERLDTLVTYNFPEGVYEFPSEYFENYQIYNMFPDSAWNDFPVSIKYRPARKDEKFYPLCRADINLFWFNKYVNHEQEKQIIIISLTK